MIPMMFVVVCQYNSNRYIDIIYIYSLSLSLFLSLPPLLLIYYDEGILLVAKPAAVTSAKIGFVLTFVVEQT